MYIKKSLNYYTTNRYFTYFVEIILDYQDYVYDCYNVPMTWFTGQDVVLLLLKNYIENMSLYF